MECVLEGTFFGCDHEALGKVIEMIEGRFLFGRAEMDRLVPDQSGPAWFEHLPAGYLQDAAQDLLGQGLRRAAGSGGIGGTDGVRTIVAGGGLMILHSVQVENYKGIRGPWCVEFDPQSPNLFEGPNGQENPRWWKPSRCAWWRATILPAPARKRCVRAGRPWRQSSRWNSVMPAPFTASPRRSWIRPRRYWNVSEQMASRTP